MLIQSPVASAGKVQQAMRRYLQSVSTELDENQFSRHKAALLSDILRPDKNLWDRADFYWQSIATKQFNFDGRQQMAEAVQAFTLDDWRDYYQRVFITRPHSLQVVAPGRWGELPTGEYHRYEDAAAIKRDHASYRVD
jgi:secreted Zn-dependent insulinase-like peptidase